MANHGRRMRRSRRVRDAGTPTKKREREDGIGDARWRVSSDGGGV